MRLSKWRGALLTFIALYSLIALAHFIFRFDAGPFESIPSAVRVLFWPGSVLTSAVNAASLGNLLAWFWYSESVLASIVLWALITWPIEFYLKKKGWHWRAGYIKALASWWELLLLVALIAAMVADSYQVLQHYPPK